MNPKSEKRSQRRSVPLLTTNELEKKKNAPSMSTCLPMVFFHCFPALAILRSFLSPSNDFRCAGGSSNAEEFEARRADSEGPEKNEWIL